MEYYKLDCSELKFVYMLNINAADWKPKMKILSEYDLIVIENGEIEFLCDNKIFLLGKSSYILALPGQNICISKKATPDTRAWILHFRLSSHTSDNTPQQYSQDNKNYIVLPKTTQCTESNVLTYINLLYGEIMYRDYDYKNLLDDLVWHILYELQRSYYTNINQENIAADMTVKNSHYIKIVTYLHKYYSKKIQASDIERLVDLNYDYINNIFKKISGKTIMESLLSLRMSVATELMCTTDFSIAEIAEMCGFADNHYFSRKFKQYQNMSPSDYRKENKL